MSLTQKRKDFYEEPFEAMELEKDIPPLERKIELMKKRLAYLKSKY